MTTPIVLKPAVAAPKPVVLAKPAAAPVALKPAVAAPKAAPVAAPKPAAPLAAPKAASAAAPAATEPKKRVRKKGEPKAPKEPKPEKQARWATREEMPADDYRRCQKWTHPKLNDLIAKTDLKELRSSVKSNATGPLQASELIEYLKVLQALDDANKAANPPMPQKYRGIKGQEKLEADKAAGVAPATAVAKLKAAAAPSPTPAAKPAPLALKPVAAPAAVLAAGGAKLRIAKPAAAPAQALHEHTTRSGG